MIIDSYDINSEPIVKLENFYGEKQHLVKKCMVISLEILYLIFDYPHKHYTFKYFEV